MRNISSSARNGSPDKGGVLFGGRHSRAGQYQRSVAAAALEDVALGWVRDALGLPSECGGSVVTGASKANFTGLAAARHALLERSGWDVENDGVFGAPQLTVVVGDEVHASLLKALGLLGLGRKRRIRVPADEQGRMRADRLPALDDSGLEIRRLLEPWRACFRADGREVRRRNAAFSVDLWNGRRDRPHAAGRAGGDRSAGTGTGGEGQSDVARPGCGSERGRIANRDGNAAGRGPSRIGAVAGGATDTGVGTASSAFRRIFKTTRLIWKHCGGRSRECRFK